MAVAPFSSQVKSGGATSPPTLLPPNSTVAPAVGERDARWSCIKLHEVSNGGEDDDNDDDSEEGLPPSPNPSSSLRTRTASPPTTPEGTATLCPAVGPPPPSAAGATDSASAPLGVTVPTGAITEAPPAVPLDDRSGEHRSERADAVPVLKEAG